jgi:iron complex outermembrane receptor protein
MPLFYLSLLLILSSVLQAENLSSLLKNYKTDSDLSKFTKHDSAGLLEVYTRQDLEKMQAHNLHDILQTIPGVYLLRGSNNLTLLTTPSTSRMPLTYARLYVNDHDMSSSSFGSAFMIWGNMPIEYIDHIEIYKATSSLEFGNENAAFIIRLYTKNAKRDSGSKVRLLVDDKGSYDTNIYTASELENDISYFAYANMADTKRKKYHNTYNTQIYTYDSDSNIYNLYGSLQYKKSHLEVGANKKEDNSFIGMGIHKTPDSGELNAHHYYIHFTQEFKNELKLQLSYDNLSYTRNYEDPNSIRIANAPLINSYNISFNDDIYSFTLEKHLHYKQNKLMLGAFYKYKGFDGEGNYHDTNYGYAHQNHFSNALNLYSVYTEDDYDISNTLRIIASLKGDFFRYSKDVKTQNELVARAGIIKQADHLQLKAFYTRGYVPLAFYQIYNPENIPYRANPQLDAPKTNIYTFTMKYKNTGYETSFEVAHMRSSDNLVYDYTTTNGWKNSSQTATKTLYQLNYSYFFNLQNKITLNLTYGDNSRNTDASSPFACLIRSYNTYKKLDFYNEFYYKNSYSYSSYNINASLDWTAAVKYHYSKDISFGLRGENILDQGYKQIYSGVSQKIPVRDQKIWLNMEYLF